MHSKRELHATVCAVAVAPLLLLLMRWHCVPVGPGLPNQVHPPAAQEAWIDDKLLTEEE
jgi:hypothetical protein